MPKAPSLKTSLILEASQTEKVFEGVLDATVEHIYWNPSLSTVQLDGDFTTDELRDIITWMDHYRNAPADLHTDL